MPMVKAQIPQGKTAENREPATVKCTNKVQ